MGVPMKQPLLVATIALAASTVALSAAPGNGDLVRTKNKTSDLYYIRDGKRCLVPGPDVLLASGLKEENAIIISDAELIALPEGPRLREAIPSYKPKDGDLVSTPTSGVYLIQDGKKCSIPSSDVFGARGFQWENVMVVALADLQGIPEGTLKPREGDLVRVAGSGGVYLIKGGRRIGIRSGDEFTNLGYKWENVITVSEEDLQTFPER